MCGIFGYAAFGQPMTRRQIIDILLNGLRRLEYRGYDSAGIAIDSGTETERGIPLIMREKGNIACLQKYIDETLISENINAEEVFNFHFGLAHTRWATHGQPCRANSHPHSSDDKNQFIVVHNGIITNYKALKTMLEGHGLKFYSETDTESISKLSLHFFNLLSTALNAKPTFAQVMIEVVRHLEGAFAILVKSTHYPGEVIAAKRGSPLLLGLVSRGSEAPLRRKFSVKEFSAVSPGSHSLAGSMTMHKDLPATSPMATQKVLVLGAGGDSSGETVALESDVMAYVFASDPSAVVEHTKNVLVLEDGDVVHIRKGDIQMHHHADKALAPAGTTRGMDTLEMELDQIMKGNFAHFMLKEIYEQTESLTNTMRGRVNFAGHQIILGGLQNFLSDIRRCRRLVFIACGTSFNSAIAARPILEELCQMPVAVENASDLLDRESPLFRDDACVFISQSGETADTLSALQWAKKCNAICIGITNTVGSAIARQTDCGVHINAGVEIGVASTKAYTSQIVSIVMMALQLSEDRLCMHDRRTAIIDDLARLPNLVSQVLKMDPVVQTLAEELKDKRSLLLLGRGYQFAACVEGALKIKEIAYMHSEGLLAGELKHGPLALVDESMPVLLICMRDRCFDKTMNAYAQLLARKSRPIVMCNEGDQDQFKEAMSVIIIPKCEEALQGILAVIPMQLLAYYIAVKRGYNVDQPRNLAKSVTVH